jgi:hypothetical protein
MLLKLRSIRFMLALVLVCGGLTACGDIGEREDLKSPCAGAEGSPCGDKRSVNDWWLV